MQDTRRVHQDLPGDRRHRVESLSRKAVEQFTAQGQVAEGNYRLVLVRDGDTTDLVPSVRLGDVCVVGGDEFALMTTNPHVDG